jgi:autotransporter translocation and assembly factor TamB
MNLTEGVLKFNGGPSTLTGTVAWGDGLEDFSFQARMTKVKVLMPRLLSGTIEKGRADWFKKGDGYRLTGDLDLSDSRWLKNFTMEVSPPTPALPDLLAKTEFNIKFRGSQTVWLDNNFGRLRVDADAALTGTWGAPTLLGRFDSLEGQVKYLDRKFTVSSASAVFPDPSVINPILTLQADTLVRSFHSGDQAVEYDVTLGVSGPLDRMQISLTSNPALADADIASLLTLGVTRQDLIARGGGGGSTTGALASRAGSYTTQALTDLSARKVGQMIGLEELAVETNPFGGTGGIDGSRVTATTRVTDRVSVTYRTDTGANPQRAVRVGYFLSNKFSLVTQADQVGQSSLDLKYRLLFK